MIKGNPDYIDMYLYTLCRIQVGSQSSWGHISFPFNKNKDKVLYLPIINENRLKECDGKIIPIELEEDMYVHEDTTDH